MNIKQMIRNEPIGKLQKGATMIEYALLAVFISIAAITVFPTIQTAILNTFTTISTSLG